MLQPNHWPFTPVRLSEIIDTETLSVIQAGCVARLQAPMTIIEPEPDTKQVHRVEPINLLQSYAPFCALLRDESAVEGGNAACEACDQRVARAALTGAEPQPLRTYRCHIGVADARHLVYVLGKPVAVLFAGQFGPETGVDKIKERVKQLGSGTWAHIRPNSEQVRNELLHRVEQLAPPPIDFAAGLQREAEHIGRLAEAQFLAIKRRWEQQFLAELRNLRRFGIVETAEQVRELAASILRKAQLFCRVNYLILFANAREGDSVLIPIATSGIPAAVAERLPHFNWRKSSLGKPEPPSTGDHRQPGQDRRRAGVYEGIRGDNREFFANAIFAAPAHVGALYKSVLLFGPAAEPIDLSQEGDFLAEIGRIIGWFVLSELHVIYLQQKQEEWKNRARLLTHQLRTTITPITTHVGAAQLMLPTNPVDPNLKLAAKYIEVAQNLCLQLGRAVEPALASHALLVERDDLNLEQYPLSVLVANCAVGFEDLAQQHQRHIIMEESIERLPSAQIDIGRLTIALSNIIENAIKYSFPGTKIYIRSGRYIGQLNLESAVIEIQDDGDPIPSDRVDQIFEAGTRLLTAAKLRQIPGSGLGLWEVRAVIEAHGGKVEVITLPTHHTYRQMRAQRVIFRVIVPLKQAV